MQQMYDLMEAILPFSWVKYDFMKNAFLAILLITPLFGFLGTMIVHKKMAFFSDALGHSAFTGIAIGILFSFTDYNLSMIIFAVIFALLLNKIKSKQTIAADTIISVFSSCSIALGLLVLSSHGKFSTYSGLLVGDILSITPKEITYLLIVFLLTIVFWYLCFNQMLAISIHPALARSRGIKLKVMENIFVVCIAVIVMISIKWVGILLINALLILPVAAARNIAVNMREYHFFAILFSMFSGVAGLLVSYYVNLSAGPMIVIFASIIFFSTFFYGRILQR